MIGKWLFYPHPFPYLPLRNITPLPVLPTLFLLLTSKQLLSCNTVEVKPRSIHSQNRTTQRGTFNEHSILDTIKMPEYHSITLLALKLCYNTYCSTLNAKSFLTYQHSLILTQKLTANLRVLSTESIISIINIARYKQTINDYQTLGWQWIPKTTAVPHISEKVLTRIKSCFSQF